MSRGLQVALLLWCFAAPYASGGRQPCPQGCTKYGTCNEELGRCDCPPNRTGGACEQPSDDFCNSYRTKKSGVCAGDAQEHCLNACNGRGRCTIGFCHCQEGYFGADCSLSYDSAGRIQILHGLGYRPNRRGPLVYVYELPPQFNTHVANQEADRPATYWAIWERILSGGHRTADPAAADYFYVPVSSRELKKSLALWAAVQYVVGSWPYWNQTQGSRHVITCEGASAVAQHETFA